MVVDKNKKGYVANIATSFLELPGLICSSVYLSGCAFNCKGCQNPELQNSTYGKVMSIDDVVNVVNENHLAKWVCFLGGEPFFQYEFLYELCKNITKPIGIYTGNNFDVICDKHMNILELPNVKFFKTGVYDENKIITGEFPITSNQRVYVKNIDDFWIMVKSRNINDVSKILANIK